MNSVDVYQIYKVTYQGGKSKAFHGYNKLLKVIRLMAGILLFKMRLKLAPSSVGNKD